jgi:hypothetical protein
MLMLDEIMETWRRQKGDLTFFRLKAAAEVFFEFRGAQGGHPSNFAFVKIAATPAEDLEIALVAEFPATLDVPYRRRLEAAVSLAAVDELLSSQWIPYRGCRLVVFEVGWDDVMSSEVAIYKATRGALMKLRQDGLWEVETNQ